MPCSCQTGKVFILCICLERPTQRTFLVLPKLLMSDLISMTQQEILNFIFAGIIFCLLSQFPEADVGRGKWCICFFVNGGREQGLLVVSLFSSSHLAKTQTKNTFLLSPLANIRVCCYQNAVCFLCLYLIYAFVSSVHVLMEHISTKKKKIKNTGAVEYAAA